MLHSIPSSALTYHLGEVLHPRGASLSCFSNKGPAVVICKEAFEQTFNHTLDFVPWLYFSAGQWTQKESVAARSILQTRKTGRLIA